MKDNAMFRFLAAAAAIFSVPAVAQESMPSSESGMIVIYRGGSIIGAAGGCPVRHKGIEVVELGRGKFAEWSVPPGRYILTNNRSSIEVNVAPGETRYVRCQIKSGFMSGGAYLQIVDRENFDAAKPGLERKDIVAAK